MRVHLHYRHNERPHNTRKQDMNERRRGKRENQERTRKTDTKTDKNREMISNATQIQVDEVSQRGQVRLWEDILFKRAPSG